MKHRFTLLAAAVLLLVSVLQPLRVTGQTREEVVAYTLDGTVTGGSNSYATESEILQNGMTWMVMGNTTMNPWRIGGKNLTEIDRPIYSTGTIADNITKVVLTHGTASNITVNSLTFIVSANDDFSSPTSTLSGDFAANEAVTFSRPEGDDWSNKHYKIVYNITVSGNSNRYLQFISAEFYKEEGGNNPNPTVATPTFTPASGTYHETQTVTIACATEGATIHYTVDGSEPTANSAVYGGALTVSETTTVKAFAAKEGMTDSPVATAEYTIEELATIGSIAGLWEFATAAGNSGTPAMVSFGGWYVTGVRNNQVCVSDGQYGFVIYQSNHGFVAGDKLEGTVTCEVLLYNNRYAEVTGVTSATEGLTVTSGQEMPVLETTIGALEVRNYGTAISLGTLTYDGSAFVDATSAAIVPYNNFNLSPSPLSALEAGKQYNVRGVSIIYWSNSGQTQQVAPRTAGDFELVEVYHSVTVAEGIANGTVTVTPSTAVEGATITVTATPDEGYNLGTLTYSYGGATVDIDRETMQFTMPSDDVTVSATFSQMETVATPTFTPASGTYHETQTVTIACATEGATIHYTVDGSEPTANSAVYGGALTVSETTTVKAFAAKEGMTDSPVATATYIITEAPSGSDFVRVTDLSQLGIGSRVIVAARYNGTPGDYYAMTAEATNKPTGVQFNSVAGTDNESVPASLAEDTTMYWTLGINGDTYTFTNTDNVVLGYGSGTNFTPGGNNTAWTIEVDTAVSTAMVPDLVGFVITNANSTSRAIALNTNHNYGAYSKSNMTNSNAEQYNFVLDLFATEGQAPTYYAVNVAAGIANGTVTVSDTTAMEGATITVTATPDNGYELATLTYSYGGATIDIDRATMQFTMPASDVTVNATFSVQQSVATPTFSPAEGSFTTAQYVTISCATEGATIYYTVDGSEPTANSAVYSSAIYVTETTTVKAMGVMSGLQNSPVASATYTILTPITIAQARALNNDEYALVQGVVTYIKGRNIYIQDETAGIDLFLNNNTVPEALNLGDMVLAYGKKAVYNGLVELSSINGGDVSQFSIVSTGNTLPLVVKTIAEILADYSGSNVLQATRVQIQGAVIGAINTGGNTPITQDGSSMNIYQLPVVEGLLEGDSVTVIGVVGCFNAAQLLIHSAADVEYTHPQTQAVAMPTFSPDGGTYYQTQTVTIACATEGATIHYTVDGSEPTANSAVYGGALTVSETTTVKAFATKTGMTDSPVATATYIITEAPSGSDFARINDLSELGNGAQVIIAARYNATSNEYYAMTAQTSGKPTGVWFTSVPGTNNETLPETIANDTTMCWTVTTDGTNYTFTNVLGEVLGYSSSTNFSTGGDNTDWSIVYETAGTSAMVPEYAGFVISNVNNNVRCVALNSNYNFGPYHTNNINNSGYNFYLDLFATEGSGVMTCAMPVFNPAGGTYYEAQEVTVTCGTADATVYYTTDGTDPTANSTVYSGPITVAESMTLKAIAMKEGYENSAIATAEYTLIIGSVAIFDQDWEGEMNGWTFVTVEGNKPWTIATYSGNHYANANGYGDNVDNEQWCISPAFNLNAYDDVSLSFVNAKNYSGPDLQLFFSNDYDGTNPSAATWTELTFNMSTGSYTWTESGAISLDNFSGSNCYIGFKYTSTVDGGAAAWEIDDIALVGFTSDPVLTVTTTTLAGLNYLEGNGPSAEQSFTLNGMNLTEAVTLTMGGDDFEMSTETGDNFNAQTSIVLSPEAGSLNQTIYVRLAEGLDVGSYTSTITVDSELDDITVSLSGNVNEQGGTWNRILAVSDLTNGAQVVIASRYDATIGNGYYAMTAAVSGKPDGVLFSSQTSGGVEVLPDAIVNDIDTYLWNVTVNDTIIILVNAAGDTLGYSSSTNFSGNVNTDWALTYGTSGDNAMVPNYSGFVITNVSTPNRGVAKNASNKFGAYSTSNINNADYNFYLDFFVQGGSSTPTVSTPVFSMASGTYYEEIDVEITCATDGATIYYTTDGTTPTTASTVYTEAIHVASNMTLKAFAVKEGFDDSNVATASYVVMTDVVILLNQDWEGEMNGWTFVTVEGNKPWTIATYAGNKYANANGYGDDVDNEQWCISPAFDLTPYYGQNVTLTFMNAKNYSGPDLELYFSNDYDGSDPESATWHPLSFEMSTGGYAWTESGPISLSGFTGESCYIGFRYISNIDKSAAAWEVDDIVLTVETGNSPYLVATPNALSGFQHFYGNGPSDVQSFMLSGGNLTSTLLKFVVYIDNVSNGFEISLDGQEFGTEFYLTPIAGMLEPTPIYVRLNGTEIGHVTSQVGISCVDLFIFVSLEGEVLDPTNVDELLASTVEVWNYDHEIMVENNSGTALEMTVYNLLGQSMMSCTVKEGASRIAHSLHGGLYLVTLRNSFGSVEAKVVVR